MTDIVTPPVVSDGDLLFTEEETRSIFSFYWPDLRSKITEMEITTENRRFGQQLLIIGIDSSYALGFMQSLVQMYLNPRAGFKGLVAMGRKLARRYLQHWWKHAKQKDLENPRVAEGVRAAVANRFRSEMDMVILNVRHSPTLRPFTVAGDAQFFWGGA